MDPRVVLYLRHQAAKEIWLRRAGLWYTPISDQRRRTGWKPPEGYME